MAEALIQVAVIGRPHGVRGRVRLRALTEDPSSVARYGPLLDRDGRAFRVAWEGQGIARISEIRPEGEVPVADRSGAEALTNRALFLPRRALPAPGEEEYYLADLIGCDAVGPEGRLGAVVAVHDYGAGASLEIAREGATPLLVPFTRAAVPEVDLAARRIGVVPPVEAAR